MDQTLADERCFVIEVTEWFLENVLFPKKEKLGRASTTGTGNVQGSPDKGRKSLVSADMGEGGKTVEDGRSSSSNLQERLRDAVLAKTDGKSAGTKAIERNFIKALEGKKKGVESEEPTTAQQILSNAAMKSLNTKSAWTNREEEWRAAEKNMTFRCSSSDECDAWIGLISQFLGEDD